MGNANSNVAALHQRGDPRRRETAIARATWQSEAIFKTLLLCIKQQRGEIPKWGDGFDEVMFPEAIRALAIRARDLNYGVMEAVTDPSERSTESLERLVSHG